MFKLVMFPFAKDKLWQRIQFLTANTNFVSKKHKSYCVTLPCGYLCNLYNAIDSLRYTAS